MKKVFLKATALALALFGAFGASACSNGEESSSIQADKVYLKGITGADAVGVVEADYFLLAEPAVSAQSKKGFSIKGDIQALYGGENGYPQAVLVAKNELVEEYAEWTASFVKKVSASAEWLKTASGAEIVSAVSANMEDEGTATSLKAPLLSEGALSRCGVRFSYASESKSETAEFLTEMIAVNEKAAKIPADKFYWTGNSSLEGNESSVGEENFSVYMPDGAPALALAGMMAQDTDEDGVEYFVTSASLIASKVTNKDEEKNADLCVLPVTAASKLLGTGERYTMLGVVTHGNLYLISKDGEALTSENMDGLKGKTIGVLNISEVPGLTLKAVLNRYDIPFEEIKSV